MRQTRTDIEPARRHPAEPELQDATALRHYLLGELAPPDAAAIEDRLFESDELFELAEAIEAELLDAEARGELAPALGSPLSKLGHSAWGRRRRDFSGALAAIDLPATLTVRERFVTAAKRATPALALAASLAGAVGLVYQIVTPPPQPPAIGTKSVPSPQETQVASIQPTEPAAPPYRVQVNLGGTRGAGDVIATPVPPGTKEVELHIDVTGENSTRFDVVVMESGTERGIRRFSDVSSVDDGRGGRALRLRLAAGLLPKGEIEIELREVDRSELVNSGSIRLQ